MEEEKTAAKAEIEAMSRAVDEAKGEADAAKDAAKAEIEAAKAEANAAAKAQVEAAKAQAEVVKHKANAEAKAEIEAAKAETATVREDAATELEASRTLVVSLAGEVELLKETVRSAEDEAAAAAEKALEFEKALEAEKRATATTVRDFDDRGDGSTTAVMASPLARSLAGKFAETGDGSAIERIRDDDGVDSDTDSENSTEETAAATFATLAQKKRQRQEKEETVSALFSAVQFIVLALVMLTGLFAVALMGAAPFDGVMVGRPSSSSSSSSSSWVQFFGPNLTAAVRLLTGDMEDPCSRGVLGHVSNVVEEWLSGVVHARYRPSCAPTRPS